MLCKIASHGWFLSTDGNKNNNLGGLKKYLELFQDLTTNVTGGQINHEYFLEAQQEEEKISYRVKIARNALWWLV
jgi:hypothetical protein